MRRMNQVTPRYILGMVVVFALALSMAACGDEVVPEIDDSSAVSIQVEGDREVGDSATPYPYFCGYATCPYTQTLYDCYINTSTHVSMCNRNCGTPKWSGCQRYNSSSCTGGGYPTANVYCTSVSVLMCRYNCYRY